MHIAGTIMTIFMSVVFMLFLNADMGWALIYMLGGTAVLSVVLFLISSRHLSVKLSELSGVSEFGRDIAFEIELRKKGFCVLPRIEITVDTGKALLPIKVCTALIFGKTRVVRASFPAAHSGLNRITITKAEVYDLLGLAKRRIKLDLSAEKAVLPRVVDYDGPEVIPSTLPSEEEEVEEGFTSQNGGLPGSEHREYVPGDPLRRVNYKLSAKKGTLMVRLDETMGTKATNLCIADNAMPICCDKAFALASRLVIRGGTVKVTHKGDERVASTPETLALMREWLAFREYADNPNEDAGFVPEDTTVVFLRSGEIRQLAYQA